METKNAIIRKVQMGDPDGRFLEFTLFLDLQNGGCVNFGGIKLGDTMAEINIGRRECGNYAAYYIEKIFEVADVATYEELRGKPVRAIFNEGLIIGIQHFLDDKKFFIPSLSSKKIDLTSIFSDELTAQIWKEHEEDWKWGQRVWFP